MCFVVSVLYRLQVNPNQFACGLAGDVGAQTCTTADPKLLFCLLFLSVEAIVEFDYQAQHDDELTISVGEVITNIRKEDGGWWEGQINGRRGLFPDNFVRVSTKSNPFSCSCVGFDGQKAVGAMWIKCTGFLGALLAAWSPGWYQGEHI